MKQQFLILPLKYTVSKDRMQLSGQMLVQQARGPSFNLQYFKNNKKSSTVSFRNVYQEII